MLYSHVASCVALQQEGVCLCVIGVCPVMDRDWLQQPQRPMSNRRWMLHVEFILKTKEVPPHPSRLFPPCSAQESTAPPTGVLQHSSPAQAGYQY